MIEASTFEQMFGAPSWPALLEEYSSEAGEYVPPVDVQFESYKQLEAMGRLHLFTATGEETNRLIGFITVLAGASLKYGHQPIAFTESFFVCKAHRMTGAGVRLLRAAESKAREIGARGLLLGAPAGGPLDQVLPRCGYSVVSRIHFRRLTDA